MASILGLASTIEQRVSDSDNFDETDRKMLGYVVSESKRLDLLLSDLLDLERLTRGVSHGVFRATDLRKLAHGVGHRMACESERIQIDEDEHTQSLIVSIDAAKVERIIENLLANALKYSDDDQKVVLRIEATERDGV